MRFTWFNVAMHNFICVQGLECLEKLLTVSQSVFLLHMEVQER